MNFSNFIVYFLHFWAYLLIHSKWFLPSMDVAVVNFHEKLHLKFSTLYYFMIESICLNKCYHFPFFSILMNLYFRLTWATPYQILSEKDNFLIFPTGMWLVARSVQGSIFGRPGPAHEPKCAARPGSPAEVFTDRIFIRPGPARGPKCETRPGPPVSNFRPGPVRHQKARPGPARPFRILCQTHRGEGWILKIF